MAELFTSYNLRINYRAVWNIAIAVIAGAVSVWFIVVGYYWVPFVLFGTVVVYGVIFQSWKRGIYGLLIYLPFAGIPTIMLYPAPVISLLIKDLLFVIPVYVSFVGWYARNHRNVPSLFAGGPIWLLSVLGFIVFVQVFNPALTDKIVGLVGVKVWLFYVPLYILGYHLIDSQDQLFSLTKLMLIVALFPALIGLLEAVLIYSGFSHQVYSFYGDAASDVTQGFAQTILGESQLVRIPSTFTFVTQYYNYLLAMLAIAYVAWMAAPRKKKSRHWKLAMMGLIALAGMLSGARGAFVLIPLFFLCIVLLKANWRKSWQPVAVVPVSVVVTILLVDTTLSDLFSALSDLTRSYIFEAQIGEFIKALNITLWGLGTGMNTNAARYLGDISIFRLENFYAKTVVELGIPGLFIILVLFGTILARGLAEFYCLRNPVLRAYSVSLIAFLLIAMINLWKGSYLDIDPLNVYFWLFAGILMKLPKLDAIEGYSQGGQPAH
jgi:hypothetical protein